MKIFKYPQLLLAAALILASYSMSTAGVKISITSGNLNFLKSQKVLLVEYDYSNMRVGKYAKEEDYINKKVTDYNKDEPGRGDKWKEAWVGDRQGRFEPQFEELINDNLGKSLHVLNSTTDAKYKMIVHTIFTEPGYNIAITKKPAIINLEITFVEISNPDKPLAKISLSKAPGKTFGMGDFDTGLRISEAYAKAGKELGKFIVDEVYK